MGSEGLCRNSLDSERRCIAQPQHQPDQATFDQNVSDAVYNIIQLPGPSFLLVGFTDHQYLGVSPYLLWLRLYKDLFDWIFEV
jgi:hypothetical protein